MKPEKSAMLTGVGICAVFTVGLIFTLLIPSFNQNWSTNTAEKAPLYHAVYEAKGGKLYRMVLDQTGSGFVPSLTAEQDSATGDVKDIVTTDPDGTTVGYTPLQLHGRRIYQREGCVYCHTQQVRPLSGEIRRYSIGNSIATPADEREYIWDQPHFLGTRRIGPDLSREGGKYSDDWHYSHFYFPRQMNPDSVMPAFTWLFTKDPDGNPVPTDDARALTAYVQTLGYGRLVYDPVAYGNRGGWGPWLRPADQQIYQQTGETQVSRAKTPVRGGDKVSPTNRVPPSTPTTRNGNPGLPTTTPPTKM